MDNSSHLAAHFLRRTVVDVDAAVVGISRERWVTIPRNTGYFESARTLMRNSRFDVLPIDDRGSVKRFLHTKKWNDYSEIVESDIRHCDVISFDTGIRDVIKAFAKEEQNFFFLVSERTIQGLISIGCLNCRQVRVYLYSLLSDLEVSLGNYISKNLSEEELIEFVIGSGSSRSNADIKKRFIEDKAKGVDVPFVEYLYLTDLQNVMVKKKFVNQLGMSSTSAKKVLGALTEFRHRVAHPIRSILATDNPAAELWKRIDQIEALLFALA